MIRTHNCGELGIGDVSKDVTLAGWITSRRDHGELIFMDLRDRRGITQIVFDPEKNKEAHEKAHELRNEFCVLVAGKVSRRPQGTVNQKLSTGQIEIEVKKAEILSSAAALPFEIKDDIDASEDVRLRYRYLDLRRRPMLKKLEMRHGLYKFLYDFLDSEGFVYVETPCLTKSTPEGARDYLVPVRQRPGCFYALPQSPQLFKQLLMVAGVEKYFQIARCFRDEDLRADRQPEFTQLDMEMSFIDREDVFGVSERLFQGLFSRITGKKIDTPFPRISYEEAMARYGTDKPDTRFALLLSDITAVAKNCQFKIFGDAISSGGKVIAMAAPGCSSVTKKEIDELIAYVVELGAKGLAYLKVEKNDVTGPIAKFFPKETLSAIKEKTGAKEGDMIFMVADAADTASSVMGALRLLTAKKKELLPRDRFDFLWVVDFPLFKFNKDENKWVSEHHPFTSFVEEDMKYIDSGELGKVRSLSYDLVLNGSEIGSGSVRIHKSDVQKKIFSALGLTEEEAKAKFGFLLEAFQYGPPPHGGIAFGLDRLITVFTGDSSIREVIPFPKTQRGTCPMTDAPGPVDEKQLRELGIKINAWTKKEETP